MGYEILVEMIISAAKENMETPEVSLPHSQPDADADIRSNTSNKEQTTTLECTSQDQEEINELLKLEDVGMCVESGFHYGKIDWDNLPETKRCRIC